MLEPEIVRTLIPPPYCDRREALAFGQFQASSSIGAMDEVSQKVQKVCTHSPCVVVDIAIGECDVSVATLLIQTVFANLQTTAILRKKGGARFWSLPGKFIHWGDGRRDGGV